MQNRDATRTISSGHGRRGGVATGAEVGHVPDVAQGSAGLSGGEFRSAAQPTMRMNNVPRDFTTRIEEQRQFHTPNGLLVNAHSGTHSSFSG